MLLIRATETAHSEIFGRDLVLAKGEIIEAERNQHGAVSAIFMCGDRLGLKPNEYEVILDGGTVAEARRLRSALQRISELPINCGGGYGEGCCGCIQTAIYVADEALGAAEAAGGNDANPS